MRLSWGNDPKRSPRSIHKSEIHLREEIVIGTFAPLINPDEITDYDPARIVRVKKMIWSEADQEFRTHYFVRVLCETSQEFEDTTTWLLEQCGDPGYQRSWWLDKGNHRWIWMTEQFATFCRLKYRK
jgi:hypothetical protein